MNSDRRKLFFLLVLVVVGIGILSMGLPDMQLQPGLPIPGAAATQAANLETPSGEGQPNNITFGAFLRGTLALGFVLLLFIFLIGLARRVNAKRLMRLAAALALVLIVLLLVPRIETGTTKTSPEEIVAESTSEFTFATAPIGNPPEQLYWFVIGFIGLSALLVGIWLLRDFFRRPKQEPSLANTADAAIQDINDGQNLQSVIIRCYLDMVKVLKEEKGIEREQSVTPREFERWLSGHGVHVTSIRQLTRLFEKARYSGQNPDRQDELAAIECLSAISIYCKQGGERNG